jgi:hypothetical protein
MQQEKTGNWAPKSHTLHHPTTDNLVTKSHRMSYTITDKWVSKSRKVHDAEICKLMDNNCKMYCKYQRMKHWQSPRTVNCTMQTLVNV